MNGSNPNGVAQLVENWHEASRQYSAICYGLNGVHVMINTIVERINLEYGKATDVEISDGGHLTASNEVIISCGALRTPQLLMLSGMDPALSLPNTISSRLSNCHSAGICTTTAR